ncbi:hypothetical protein P7D72_01655 [Enterococcus avium]|uniref:hypothetical protein n=1 Tax=Enterococcus avium TaxID=33945 RepID=UPI00288F4F63|nr:hypothetical protein [Enterococcus avium]MDT2490752.1 hypothetical protein [Enterococcus avium]
MEKRVFGSKNQILADVSNYKSLSVVVDSTGVTETNGEGKKIIPAGTPVGAADPFADEQAAVKVTNEVTTGDKMVGVLLHDVVFDVDSATGNGTLLYFGTVNEYRLDDKLTIVNEAKTALDGKVYFVKRNK